MIAQLSFTEEGIWNGGKDDDLLQTTLPDPFGYGNFEWGKRKTNSDTIKNQQLQNRLFRKWTHLERRDQVAKLQQLLQAQTCCHLDLGEQRAEPLPDK